MGRGSGCNISAFEGGRMELESEVGVSGGSDIVDGGIIAEDFRRLLKNLDKVIDGMMFLELLLLAKLVLDRELAKEVLLRVREGERVEWPSDVDGLDLGALGGISGRGGFVVLMP
jgi:hypothetical protein